MRNRTDRLNRVLLVLLGLVFLLAGAGAILLGRGVFGSSNAHRGIIDDAVGKPFIDNASWLWWAIGAVTLVLALLALYWLIVQLRIERIGGVTLQARPTGESTISARALTGAIRADAESVDGVNRAHARLMRDDRDPELVLSVWLREGADLGRVRHELEATTITHARDALGGGRIKTWLRVEIDTAERVRVH